MRQGNQKIGQIIKSSGVEYFGMKCNDMEGVDISVFFEVRKNCENLHLTLSY